MDTLVTGGTKWGKKKPAAKKHQSDKRADHRHTLKLDAEIHFREQALKGMFRCCTSNVGLQGAFFPAKNLPISYKTEIDLVFHVGTNLKAKEYRMSAKLVRLQDDGAAMVFSSNDDKQTQDFRRFLFKAKVAARK